MRLICMMFFWLAPMVAHASSMADAVLDATVTIYTADGRDRFLGSGFVYGASDRGITNAHVVGDAKTVLIITRDGTRMTARVVRKDDLVDLAELQFAIPAGTPLQASTGTQVGDVIFTAGAPLEAGFTLTAGIVSHAGRQIEPHQPVLYLQHSAPLNPGSSGGPLVDAQGRLLGVNTRIANGSRFFVGIAYAVPTEVLTRFLAGLPSAPAVAPGLQLRPLTSAMADALGITGPGVLVDHVAAGSPAERAGIKAGDVLRMLDGQVIHTPGDIAFVLRDAGDQVSAHITRAGQDIEATLTLIAAPTLISGMQGAAPSAQTAYALDEMGITVDSMGQVTATGQSGIGFFAGLRTGDVILAVNGTPITEMMPNWPATLKISAPAVVLIRLADGATRHYVLDPWDTGRGLQPDSRANVMDQAVVRFD